MCDAEGVSDKPIQVEHVGEICIIVGQHEVLDNVDEACGEHAVTMCEVGVEDILRDVQLAHDNVEPALVMFLHAGSNGGNDCSKT